MTEQTAIDVKPVDVPQPDQRERKKLVAYGKKLGLNEYDSLLIAAVGRDMGLTPTRALGSVNIIKGRPVMSAAGMMGLILERCPDCEIVVTESSDKAVRIKARRRQSHEWSDTAYTIEQAKNAGLLAKSNWKNYPEDMLYARCVSRMARRLFADVIQGCYVPEEAEDIEDTRGPRVTQVRPV